MKWTKTILTDFYLFNPSHPIPSRRRPLCLYFVRIKKPKRFLPASFFHSLIWRILLLLTKQIFFIVLDGWSWVLVLLGWMDRFFFSYIFFIINFITYVPFSHFFDGFLSFTQLSMFWNLKFWFELNRGRGNDDFCRIL